MREAPFYGDDELSGAGADGAWGEKPEGVPAADAGEAGRTADAVPNPADGPAPADTQARTTKLNLDELARGLAQAADPLAFLASMVADVRKRARVAGTPGHERALAPSASELRLAERLVEAGLLADDVQAPDVRVVRPRTSGLFYLRVDERRLPYLAKLRVLAVEAALNAALLASRVLMDEAASSGELPVNVFGAQASTREKIVRAEQRVARSIAAQAARRAARSGAPAFGEWDVRHALAQGIEGMRLPWRLTARWRVNVAAGRAAFEVDLVPPRIWPKTAFVEGLGVVEATVQMRRRAATDYNLRLGVLMAAHALAVSPQLTDVWVQGVVDSGTAHRCYYSAHFSRQLLDGIDLTGSFDAAALMRAAGAVMDEDSGELSAVGGAFSLDDERFCPRARWDAPELSTAALDAQAARALGCTHVSDLGVVESAARSHAAAELVRRLGGSTEQNVRALLDAAAGAPADVADAARRCVGELIEGTLADDPLAIAEAFVDKDPLAQAAARAHARLFSQDIEGAGKAAREALAYAGEKGLYQDEGSVTWRAFDNYVDRVVYNRLVGVPGEDTHLASPAYLEALVIASVAELASQHGEKGVQLARRAAYLAPLSTQARLHLVQALMATGELDEAEAEARCLLELAHDPAACGLGYFAMAHVLELKGNHRVAVACGQRAAGHLGLQNALADIAGSLVEVVVGASDGEGGAHTADPAQVAKLLGLELKHLSDDEVVQTLAAANIPLAPTRRMAEVFLEGAEASVNAELFCVARDFLQTLAQMSRDDVYFGMMRSLEDEPDR